MNGFRAFAMKELIGTIRTWRIWVVPGVLLFCGITSPLTARLLPYIAKASAGSSHGVIIKIPPPVALDGYAQYIGNLAQLAVFAILIVGGGLVSSELKSGTGVLVLTKPVSRSAFVMAKAVMQLALVVAATTLATLVCLATTGAVFGGLGPAGRLLWAVLAWLAYAVLLVAVSLFFSVVIRSQAGAAGAGFGVFVGLSVFAAVPALTRFTPAGLSTLPGHLIDGKSAAVLWPVATGVVTTAVFLALAVSRFRRKEI